jgi:hypothetical protein
MLVTVEAARRAPVIAAAHLVAHRDDTSARSAAGNPRGAHRAPRGCGTAQS